MTYRSGSHWRHTLRRGPASHPTRVHLPEVEIDPHEDLAGPPRGGLFSAKGVGRASTQDPGRLRDRTRQVFGPRSERPLSEEDARGIGEYLADQEVTTTDHP
jgi:hypothetical protein